VTRPVNRLLYLVHGAPSYYHEAAYSMLSLWRQPGGEALDIVVVTDDPAPLRALIGDPPRLHILVFSDEQRQVWQGSIGYVHRMKPCAFQWAIDQLDNTGDPVWAFIDSDTVFTRPPGEWFDAVAQGAVVLHAQEGTVDGNRSHSRSQRRLAEACAKHTVAVRGQLRRISGASTMWNSGVIGLRASQREILRETVTLIDTLYPVVPIHTIEQRALPTIRARPSTPCWTPASASRARNTRPSTAWSIPRSRTETEPDGSLRVVLPQATHEARAAYAASGMLSAAQDYEFGGMQLPYTGRGGGQRLLCGKASISIGSNLLTTGNANLLMVHGTPLQQQVFALNEFNGRWSGTMCLSEPQAGSSLSDVATRAVPDGETAMGATRWARATASRATRCGSRAASMS
jgi:hypothetical protein